MFHQLHVVFVILSKNYQLFQPLPLTQEILLAIFLTWTQHKMKIDPINPHYCSWFISCMLFCNLIKKIINFSNLSLPTICHKDIIFYNPIKTHWEKNQVISDILFLRNTLHYTTHFMLTSTQLCCSLHLSAHETNMTFSLWSYILCHL